MNYFPFHIGDYAAHTAHLEPLEDLAYRRLIELYYLREGPLPTDVQATAKLIRMRSMLGDVESVLREFFTLTDDGWFHSRCDAELDAMLHRQQMAKDKANKRWHSAKPERSKATAAEKNATAYATASEIGADAMLPTPTPIPTPVLKEKTRKSAAPPRPADVPESVWNDFLAVRKAKRSPLTATALTGIESEALKANIPLAEAISACCEFGWQSFNAGWYADRVKKPVGKTDALMARNIAAASRFLEGQT